MCRSRLAWRLSRPLRNSHAYMHHDHAPVTSPPWRWFAVWIVVGAAFALGSISVIGIVVLPIAGIATALLARNKRVVAGIVGIVSGAGLPFVYVAYLNRDGPGTICTATNGGESCRDEWSPWPWLGVGVGLVALGVALFVGTRRRAYFAATSGHRTL